VIPSIHFDKTEGDERIGRDWNMLTKAGMTGNLSESVKPPGTASVGLLHGSQTGEEPVSEYVGAPEKSGASSFLRVKR
jgi:hypothetical protein